MSGGDRSLARRVALALGVVTLGACDRHSRRQLRDTAGRRFEFVDIVTTRFAPDRQWLVSGSESHTIRALHIPGAPTEPTGSARWCLETPEVNGVGRRQISICERATAVYYGEGREPGCAALQCDRTSECPYLPPMESGLCFEHRCWVTSGALRCIQQRPSSAGAR